MKKPATKSIRLIFKYLVTFISLFALVGCGGESTPDDPADNRSTTTVADVIRGDDNFSTLEAALEAADLMSTLDNGSETFTVFAPTNEAFDLEDNAELTALLADPPRLRNVLLYHVIIGKEWDGSEVVAQNGSSFSMANGKAINVDVDFSDPPANKNPTDVFVDGVNVSQTNIDAGNGIIHAIDAVLEPRPNFVEALQDDDRFETLVEAVVLTDLVGALSVETDRLTLIAPTDDAFAASTVVTGYLNDAKMTVDMEGTPEEQAAQQETIDQGLANLTRALQYHVLSQEINAETALTLDGETAASIIGKRVDISVEAGTTVEVNDVEVTEPDGIIAGNGIVHIIESDTLLPLDNIWEYLLAEGDTFSTLRAALETAGLDGAIADESKDFTIFAPNNEAFEESFGGPLAIEALLSPNNRELLTNTLLFHVLPTEQNATAVANAAMNNSEFETLLNKVEANPDEGIEAVPGVNLPVGENGSEILLNDEVAVNPINEAASNGIVHLLEDGVLTAPTPTPTPSPSPAPVM